MSKLKTISDKLDYIAMGKLNAEQMEYICEIDQEVNLKDKEIERLTAESTEWESKFYNEAKKVDKAIEYIHWRLDNGEDMYITQMTELLDILKGEVKE